MAEKKKLDLALIFGEPKGPKGPKENKESMKSMKSKMSEEDSEGTSEEEDEEESDEESTAIKDIWQAIKDDDEEAFASAFKIFKNC